MDQLFGLCIVNRQRADELLPLVERVHASGKFKLKEMKILPDVMFNVSGISVGFMVVEGSLDDKPAEFWERMSTMGSSIQHSYVLSVAPPQEVGRCSLAFLQSAPGNMVLGKPPMLFVENYALAAEKMINLAVIVSEAKTHGTLAALQEEKEQYVCSTECLQSVATAIPGLPARYGLQLLRSLGSIKEIASASAPTLMAAAMLDEQSADRIQSFFLSMHSDEGFPRH